MNVQRIEWDPAGATAVAAALRALQPALAEVSGEVAAIIAQVRAGGDGAVAELERRFGGVAADPVLVEERQLRQAPERIPPELRAAIELAVRNVWAVAETDLREPASVDLAAGQRIDLREVAVGSAGAYVPGGGAAYPSTAVMCCVPASVAGVERIVVATPPGPDGRVRDLVLAACAIAGADQVYAIGGAQAIAALALGTETIRPVDVICGPGNRYVQEAKRQLVGTVGIDGIAGPSELMVIFVESDPTAVALNLLAQAEHGSDGLLVGATPDPTALDALETALAELAPSRPTVCNVPIALVETPDLDAAAELANALAPEHLELAGADTDDLAGAVRFAGAIFTGPGAATAFGDYVAGSNHVLPTGGAGRFTGPLGPRAFRRRQAIVHLPATAARALAPPTATLARAEGFPVHGESAEARAKPDSGGKR